MANIRRSKKLFLVESLSTSILLFIISSFSDWSPRENKLLFWANREGNPEVYAVNLDGSRLVNLTNHPSEDANPVWSPDGKFIAFYSKRDGNGEIYVMDADGSNLRNVTQHYAHDFNPSWAPNGKQITFQSYRDGRSQIYTMNADGKNQINLSRSGFNDSNPDWSSDGSQIVFVSDRTGSKSIYTMTNQGRNQKLLVNVGYMDLENPKWNHDDSKIVYHGSQKIGTMEIGTIFIYSFKTTQYQSLTKIQAYNYNPFFSPDGNHISFNRQYPNGPIELWVMTADGKKEIKIH